MIFRMSSRLYYTYPVLHRFPCINNEMQCLKKSFLQNSFICWNRHLHLKHPKQYNLDKYAELNTRLESVPYLNLLNRGMVQVQQDLTYEDNKELEDALKWCSKVFDYNVKNGKKIRAVALLKAYCAYAFNMDDILWQQWESNGWKSAVILAWCVELLQAFFVVLDDIMDQSSMRRGEPCWYKKPDVGMCAINDSLLLYCGIYKLLLKHFSDLKCYNSVLHEFLQITHKTAYGQSLDMLFNPLNQKPKFESFTFEKYKTLVEYKTSNYTYCLPVFLAMHLAGGYTAGDFNFARNLCLKLGMYFQSQDDYLDCYGNSKLTGKYGNDIREGKCTWFSVNFLEEASQPMKQEFLEIYGSGDKDSIPKVMELYRQASLLEKFEYFDKQMCSEINSLIESMGDVKGGLYYNLFSQIQKREK